MQTIFWYDLETTGIDPARDRAIQFAGVRTNLDLEVIGEPIELFCRLSEDIIPHPEALMVSGIMITGLQKKGLLEKDFAQAILAEFSRPNTCVAGYNSIRFDDEFTRHLFYRNFHDAYAREWQSGNSRWDVIDLFRTACALRPDNMNWPINARGVPSFKLEELTKANGIGHQKAHDAVSDVIATIELTARMKQAQPKLCDFYFNLRLKRNVLSQLYPLGKSPVIHVSGMYSADRGRCAIVLPLCTHPTNSNGIICYDLSEEPSALIDLGVEEIGNRLFARSGELREGESRIALKTIHINKSPSVSPLSTMDEEVEKRLGLSKSLCLQHMSMLQKASGVVEKIQDLFARVDYEQQTDPDLMLYQGGFFSDSDKLAMEDVRASNAKTLITESFNFQDERLDEMLFRYRARNYRDSLSDKEAGIWEDYIRHHWQAGTGADHMLERIPRLKEERPDRVELLEDLERYLLGVKAKIFTD